MVTYVFMFHDDDYVPRASGKCSKDFVEHGGLQIFKLNLNSSKKIREERERVQVSLSVVSLRQNSVLSLLLYFRSDHKIRK